MAEDQVPPKAGTEINMATKLYVGGLSYSTSSEELKTLFSQVGTVESAAVITDKFTGRSRGFGFVEMSTNEEAEAAIQKLNGQVVDGRNLTVNPANSQGARPSGGGAGSRGRGAPRRSTPRW